MKLLKQYLLLAFTACALFMLSACDSGEKPGDVAVEFTKSMLDGNADKCYSYIYIDEMDSQSQEMAKGKITLMVKEVSAKIKAQGGVKSVKLIDVTDNKTDEKRKNARVEYTLNNGDSKVGSYELIKDKKGAWKIDL